MDKEFSLKRLHELLKPGDTVGTLTQYATASTTWVRLIISRGLWNGEAGPTDISALAAPAIGLKYGTRNHQGIPFTETGTDAEAGVLLQLGRVMWRDGWECIGDGCPSGEHYNGGGAASRTPGLIHHDIRALHHKRL